MLSPQKPALRLITGGLAKKFCLSGVTVMAAPLENAPFNVQAMVREEDTYLLLSENPTIREPRETVRQLTQEAAEFEPIPPGSVLRVGGKPLQLVAVVYDIEEEPNCRDAWIDLALKETLLIAQKNRFEAIAIPLLGVRHGKISPTHFIRRLVRTLGKNPHDTLKRLWLKVPPHHLEETHRCLEPYLCP